MTLLAPENHEMNGQVQVTLIMLCKIAHYLMVQSRVLEAYIILALMYTTDHIFPVLQIKYIINKDGEMTTTFKLVTCTKPLVSYLRVLFFHVLYGKVLHTLTKRR